MRTTKGLKTKDNNFVFNRPFKINNTSQLGQVPVAANINDIIITGKVFIDNNNAKIDL